MRTIPVQAPESDAELEQEAEWVYDNAFMSFPISKQVGVVGGRGMLRTWQRDVILCHTRNLQGIVSSPPRTHTTHTHTNIRTHTHSAVT